ncbi:cytochrome C oxidase subunit IV family protein [Pendulispora albinea]|uniref:Cytochrome C oxidase subunit IV family protein n=1 Tax=Pendulispora albinea TaxID=2741071 RepID=A0ABZ2LTH2_9BACT
MSDTSHSVEHDHGHHGGDDGAVHAHISSARFYVGIFATLVALTVLTVGLSYIHLGPLNLAVAILIASIKASLVVMFFMHLRYDNKFNALIFVCSLLFIGVFFAYTMNDTEHRGQVDLEQGTEVLPVDGKPAPGGMPEAPAPSQHKDEHGPQVGGGAGRAEHGGGKGEHEATPKGGDHH